MAFTLNSVDQLFPSPLFRFEIEGANKLNAALLKEIAGRRKAEDGISKSNRRGWHSATDLFERKEPAQAELARMLLVMMANATREVSPDSDFSSLELVSEGWINANPKGAYNCPHDHPGAFWSGCYYVHVPKSKDEDAGAIEFLSPHKPLPGQGVIKGPITSDKVRIKPKAGLVLLFPATLLHWVHPNDSNEERVTVAFNGYFRKKRADRPSILLRGGGRPRS